MKLKSFKALKPIDPIEWLSSYDLYPKFYWKSKETDFEVATLGQEHEINDLSEIDNYDNMVNVVLSFDLDLKKSKIWVPSFELTHSSDATTLFSYKTYFLKDAKPHLSKPNKIHSCQITPDFKRWDSIITAAKKKIKKVVIARKQSICMEKDVDALFVFSNLKKKCKDTFLFFYQPSPLIAFLGASPETLFIKEQNKIISESIAGTRKRGETNKQDAHLKSELIKNKKEQMEFNFVKDHIKSIYEKICLHYDVSKTNICKTKWVQHLHAKFVGQLKSNFSTKELITFFHPTPAVSGVPKKQALSFIHNFEFFDRLFYAAPIGRASRLSSEIAVGIRSCYIKKNQLDVFAGTGIVDSSNSKDEWKELQNKSDWIFEVI